MSQFRSGILHTQLRAHAGQTDKRGLPYVHHPFHLAEQMNDENSTVVALLHDVVEDTDYTIGDIKGMGYGDAVVEALKLLTHDPDVPYMEYIKAKNVECLRYFVPMVLDSYRKRLKKVSYGYVHSDVAIVFLRNVIFKMVT